MPPATFIGGYPELKSFALALLLVQARLMPLFVMMPFMNRTMVPRTVAMAFAAGIGLLVVPLLWGAGKVPTDASFLLLLVKEAVIGLILGFLVAVPFWMFEIVGFVVDNQRGASMASMMNPATGNDTSPLGIALNLAFIAFFMTTGGMTLLLSLIYDSYRLWDPLAFWPGFQPGSGELILGQLNRLMLNALLLAAPMLVAMWLAEIGLAIVSRFAPQLQVFFLAMPIKSALGVLVLVLYAGTMFDFGAGQIRETGTWVQVLDPLFREQR